MVNVGTAMGTVLVERRVITVATASLFQPIRIRLQGWLRGLGQGLHEFLVAGLDDSAGSQFICHGARSFGLDVWELKAGEPQEVG